MRKEKGIYRRRYWISTHPDIPETRLNEFADAAGASASRRLCAETRSRGEFLITIQVDVVDAHFASLNTIHYLLKVLVFDLQSITNQ